MPSVYSIDGSLNISLRDISSAGTIFNDISVNIYTEERPSQGGMLTATAPTYYIQLEYDVNSEVEENHTSDEVDDTFSLPELTFTNVSVNDGSNNVSLMLPTSNRQYTIGVVNFITDSSDVSIDISSSFVKMDLSLNDQGLLFAGNLYFDVDNSNNVYATQAKEDLTKATKIYIGETPTINYDHPDTPLKGSDLESDSYTNYLTSIGGAVTSVYDNKQVIDSWTITINEIAQSQDSPLTLHCRNWRKDNNNNLYFEDGTKFVTSSSSTFDVSIMPINGDAISLFDDNPQVYGVIVQTTGVTTGLA